MQRLFQQAKPLLQNNRIVIFVDEAQNMPCSEEAKAVLDCLHRDPKGIPAVAAFFGLSDTQNVLSKCGLSRFASGRVLNLTPLNHDDAASAIRGMFEAYNFADPNQFLEIWIERLTDLSQGWPQHINSLCVAAAGVICEHGGRVAEELLPQVLERGGEKKNEYYASRIKAISGRPWVFKQLAAAAGKKNGVLSWDEIERLTRYARDSSGETIE